MSRMELVHERGQPKIDIPGKSCQEIKLPKNRIPI